MKPSKPYNPLDKLNLGNSVAKALLESEAVRMDEIEDVRGAGVYAIYYCGPFPAYASLAEQNKNGLFSCPIYVGKAIPKGGRKGGLSADSSTGTALRDRLKQHAKSIEEANNLELFHFYYRSLVVDDIWIPLGENVLIEEFKPVWNMVVDGFGNKDPGNRRAGQFKSAWDILHPGRSFAVKLAEGGQTGADITGRITEFFAGRYIPEAPIDEGD